jgi:hypothetical protein
MEGDRRIGWDWRVEIYVWLLPLYMHTAGPHFIILPRICVLFLCPFPAIVSVSFTIGNILLYHCLSRFLSFVPGIASSPILIILFHICILHLFPIFSVYLSPVPINSMHSHYLYPLLENACSSISACVLPQYTNVSCSNICILT